MLLEYPAAVPSLTAPVAAVVSPPAVSLSSRAVKPGKKRPAIYDESAGPVHRTRRVQRVGPGHSCHCHAIPAVVITSAISTTVIHRSWKFIPRSLKAAGSRVHAVMSGPDVPVWCWSCRCCYYRSGGCCSQVGSKRGIRAGGTCGGGHQNRIRQDKTCHLRRGVLCDQACLQPGALRERHRCGCGVGRGCRSGRLTLTASGIFCCVVSTLQLEAPRQLEPSCWVFFLIDDQVHRRRPIPVHLGVSFRLHRRCHPLPPQCLQGRRHNRAVAPFSSPSLEWQSRGNSIPLHRLHRLHRPHLGASLP